MSVQVVGSTLIVSDRTRHQAKSVGDGKWVVSYLPGRTLTLPQSVAAIRVAEDAGVVLRVVGPMAAEFGLTALEAIGLASKACDWPDPGPGSSRRRVRVRRWIR